MQKRFDRTTVFTDYKIDPKGQLISKCHNLEARAEIVKFFRWYFGHPKDILKLTDL